MKRKSLISYLIIAIVFFFISNANSQSFYPPKHLLVGKWKIIKRVNKSKETDLSNISECNKRSYLEMKDSIATKVIYTNFTRPCEKTIQKYLIIGNYFFSEHRSNKEILKLNDTILILKSEGSLIETYKKIN